MKVVLALLSLFFLLKPVVPVVEYLVNKDYIVKTYCVAKDEVENTCQGKCHLSKKIVAYSDLENESKDTQNQKSKYVEVLFCEPSLYDILFFITDFPLPKQDMPFIDKGHDLIWSLLKPPISF